MNEFQAEMMDDLRQENEQAEFEETPAESWRKITELAKSLENDVKDLQALLAKPAFTFDENGKMIF